MTSYIMYRKSYVVLLITLKCAWVILMANF